jgi:glutathione S-transferase
MKLYAFPLSPFSAKVRMALDEKGLEYETHDLETNRQGIVSKPAELLEINPRGQVPALIDGSVRIYDSTVIVEYLEDRYPEPPLYPLDAAERALCRQLEDAGDEALTLGLTPFFQEVWRKPDPADRDQAAIDEGVTHVRSFFERLERTLDGRDWLCSDFTVADLACFVPVMMASALECPPDSDLRRLAAWRDRVAARPSVARDQERMLKDAARVS